MAKINMLRLEEIPLEDLTIGKGQVRTTSDIAKDIDELADSIRIIGLIHPIIVCPGDEDGKYEILTGQRRFYAHQILKLKSIKACVIDKPANLAEAKAISAIENMVRAGLTQRDKLNACMYFYNIYKSIKVVCEETGLPVNQVEKLVKYPTLKPEMKKMVDDGDIYIDTALKAQKAASTSGTYNSGDAIVFAKELASMSGAQQKRVVKDRIENPESRASDVIEAAKGSSKVTQIIIELGVEEHRSLKKYAKDESTTLVIAGSALISEGLAERGYGSQED